MIAAASTWVTTSVTIVAASSGMATDGMQDTAVATQARPAATSEKIRVGLSIAAIPFVVRVSGPPGAASCEGEWRPCPST